MERKGWTGEVSTGLVTVAYGKQSIAESLLRFIMRIDARDDEIVRSARAEGRVVKDGALGVSR